MVSNDYPLFFWPYRLSARTIPFHGIKASSILARVTNAAVCKTGQSAHTFNVVPSKQRCAGSSPVGSTYFLLLSSKGLGSQGLNLGMTVRVCLGVQCLRISTYYCYDKSDDNNKNGPECHFKIIIVIVIIISSAIISTSCGSSGHSSGCYRS